MKRMICLLIAAVFLMTGAVCLAESMDLQETYMSYYRSALKEADRFDYMDYGDGAVGYQYAFIYLSAEDTIPALLLAEVSPDEVRYIKVFQYSPEQGRLLEPLQPLNEYRACLYSGKDGRGLLLWYSDGAYDAGIFEVRLSGEELEYVDLWKGPNDGSWPPDVPKTEIVWTDVSKDNLPVTPFAPAADPGAEDSSSLDPSVLNSEKMDQAELTGDATTAMLRQLLKTMGPFTIVSYDRSQEIQVRVSDDGLSMIVEANLDLLRDPENFVTYVYDY